MLLSDPVSFLRTMLLLLPGIVIAISFHEFGHARMADRLGDPTPRSQGRVTISPLAHIDPWGLLMLFVFRFGYGRPVMINPAYFRNRKAGRDSRFFGRRNHQPVHIPVGGHFAHGAASTYSM